MKTLTEAEIESWEAAVIARIAAHVQSKLWADGMSLRQAAPGAGISFNTLARVQRGGLSPSLTTLLRLLAWLDLQPLDLIPRRETR